MSTAYHSPRLLKNGDDLKSFACRSSEQTDWLRNHARQASAAGTARALVVTEPGSPAVVGYYAWRMDSILKKDAPARWAKGAGRYSSQPVALLARLAVHIEHEGRGLGAWLLQDVIHRTASLGEEIGCRGLVVHAETVQARDFYLHVVPDFDSVPNEQMRLVLLMKDIRRLIRNIFP